MVDYEKLGLKSGVEIHQQILTDKKLFCNCPAGKYTTEHDSEVLRHMRPTLSEFGTYDGTALMEFKTKKNITYLLNNESVCTYEMDDTPPFLVNKDALDIAIEISLMLNCTVVDEMHIIRKQYLDGSIPTGFQRTAIVGLEGEIPFHRYPLKIRQLGFEEDSCREVSNEGHNIVFKTDRLGMPLVEVVTEAQMKTPKEVAEVIKHIGLVLKSTGKIRRGSGAVRQDINVSIKGGTRVELKGVPSYRYAEKVVHTEACRQKNLLEIKDLLKKKKITKENLKYSIEDLTKTLTGTKFNRWKDALEAGGSIKAIMLPDLNEILNYVTQPTKTLLDEIKERVKVIACIDKWPIIVNTNNFPGYYEGYDKDMRKICAHFDVSQHSNIPILLCAGSADDTDTAMNEILDRIYEAMEGVPSETRRSFPSGISVFERILPGPDRMYPDTDLPLTKIPRDKVLGMKEALHMRPWESEKRYSELGIPSQYHEMLIAYKKSDIIEDMLAAKLDGKQVAIFILEKLKSASRKDCDTGLIATKKLIELLSEYSKGSFFKEHFRPLLVSLAKGTSVHKAIEKLKLEKGSEMKERVAAIIADTKLPVTVSERSKRDKGSDWKDRVKRRKINFICGHVLKEISFRYSAKDVADMVQTHLDR
jgi:glutamyl-tRNA(Gln) amidotransferase subunit E